MKIRLLAILATLLLLVTFAAFAVSANGAVTEGETTYQNTPFDGLKDPCPHCGKILSNESDWTEFTNSTTFAAGGHYKISQNLTLNGQKSNTIGEAVIWIRDNVVVTAKSGSNAFRSNSNGNTWIYGGSGAVITGKGATGSSATTNGGLFRVLLGGKLHFGGDLTVRLTDPINGTHLGGLIDVYAGTIYMEGGTLVGADNDGAGTVYGAVIVNDPGGSFEMSGGHIIGGSANMSPIYMRKAGNVRISGGQIDGGSSAADGGAIYMSAGTTTITGGTINGGTATNGGAIYVAGGSLVMQSDANHANGGTVNGSVAEKGGAIYLDEEAKFTLTKGTVNGCNIVDTTTTTINGGAIYSVATGTDAVQLNGGTGDGGTIARKADTSKGIAKLEGRGSAIYINGGVLTIGGANIVGGKAQEGGCVYINAGTLKMTAGTMSGGDALSNGGAVFVKGTMDMSGGTVTANPKNTYAYSKGIRVVNGTLNLSGTAKVISAGGSEGNAVYAVSTNKNCLAKVTLAGSASVTNPDGSNAYNIFLSNYGPSNSTTRYSSKIEVKTGWKGTASVKFGYIYSNDYAMPDAEYSIGMQIPAVYAAATGDFDGTLYMEVAPGTPTIWWDGATGLKTADVQIYEKNGIANEISWFKSNAAAVAAYEAGYIKLYNSNAMNLGGKTVYVDFNGNSSEVTLAGGKLYGFDSSASTSAAGTSSVTVTDGAAELYGKNPVTNQYSFALQTEGVTTFHAVAVGINSVSLRPGSAGLYYGAQFLCDGVLEAYLDSFGVALSLSDLPGADFATDNTVLYTANGKDKFGAESYNSVLVNNIMNTQRSAEQNKAYAEIPIYANAYMQFVVDGETVVLTADAKSAELSLKTVMQRINGLWRTLDQSARISVIEKLYNPYISQFAENDWNLFHIEAEKNGQSGVTKELKILTIGNSLAVDAGRMLAYVAQQEGAEGIKVGTLYKANCSVQEHADFLVNDKPNYWYYESGFDAQNPATLEVGSLVPSETRQYVGYNAIVAEDWDIIIMQHSVFGSANPDTYDESIDVIIDYVNAHKTNPNAIFAWNMTWMGPVDKELLDTASASSPGFDKSYISYTKDPLDREAQTMMYNMIAQSVYQQIMPDNRFVYVLPSATMMQNALTATSDKVMYRDYIHGSDYGRLMNAYLWYSILTGKTITEPAVGVIPGALRQATANQGNDLTLSQRMKDILVESINNAIKNPYEETTSKYQKEESLKVLAIGNSFSQDAMWHLEEIARSEGYVNVKLGILYIGGSSLKTNWEKASDDLPDYQYYYNYDGNWENSGGYNTSIAQALAQQEWDIVTLQQASGGSGQSNTYEPYLENLIEYVQTNEPDAKILWHMTWAYAQDSTHSSFPNYNSDQMTMYNAITAATQDAVVPYMIAGDISALIPSGSAIQNARSSYAGDAFDRDGYHLNINGRIVAAATWYSVLTGDSLDELSAFYFDDHFISGKPNVTLSNADREMIVEAVNNAIANPYQVTAFAN